MRYARWMVFSVVIFTVLIALAVTASAADVLGTKKVIVLRVYFKDYTATSRYSKSTVEGFFNTDVNTLWQNTSYNKISISAQVTDLFQLPGNRNAYIDDNPLCEPDPTKRPFFDLSCDKKFSDVLDDAIAKSPTGLDWKDIDAVLVLMAETDPNQFHRGQGGCCWNLAMGPGGKTKSMAAAIFSENPFETNDRANWGRWAHEIGHAFQQGRAAHPSNYNSEFELMDSNYPGQTGVFEKLAGTGFPNFPGWMPPSKYQTFTPSSSVCGGVGVGGGDAFIWAEEFNPVDRPNIQAVKACITDNLYYMISVRRRVLGDDLNADFLNGIPDEGVLIERVSKGSDPWVVVKGKSNDRNKLWKQGDNYNGSADGIFISVEKKIDNDNYQVSVRYDDQKSLKPDVMLNPWISPPGNTYETTDIWIDSPVNGYSDKGVYTEKNYRYGVWDDGAGKLVPRGNGDDPAIGQVNRLYARVRNVGGKAATDVVVRFELTDPPGLGIAGAKGWKSLGTVTKAEFPELASISPGDFVDVYLEWKPDFPISPEDMAAGRFAFHSCVRVKIDAIPGETVLGNQDGDGEQENIGYFQVSSPGPKFTNVIHLRNDDPVNRKFFYLNYKSDLPDDWILDVNNGVLGVDLGPDEVRDIPIVIEPIVIEIVEFVPAGSIFGVDVSASSMRLLANDLDPKDLHPEFKTLGGVRVEARGLLPTTLSCQAERQSATQISIKGKLEGFDGFYDPANPLRVMIEGVDSSRKFLSDTIVLVDVAPDGSFSGNLAPTPNLEHIQEAICLFAGTIELASSASGYVPILPTCFGAPATIIGTPVGETLIGTAGDDVIVGLGGNDAIDGKGGNDLLCGNEGDDTIRGGIGDDRIDGGSGNDGLHGNAGKDTILGGEGNDVITGDDGDDFIDGGPGDDRITGDPGNDRILGGLGADIIAGGGGDDTIDGGPDKDRINGGPGTDGCVNGEIVAGCP